MPRTDDRRWPDLRPLLERAPAPFAALAPEARATVLASAVRHGLLAAAAGRLPADDGALRTRFARLAAGARLRDARLREVLEEVLAVLGAAGVAPVALKGPTLADRVYPEPALRAATDLDLLVDEDALGRAADALVAAGFRRDAPLREAYLRAEHHHLHLDRVPGPAVELHFRAASAFGAAIPTRELRARAVPHRTGRGTPLLVLAPEDEVVTLSVHAAGHMIERAGWLLDLALLVERSPHLDWTAIARRARAWRCRSAVAYTITHLRSLGVPIPADPVLSLGPARRRLADRLACGAVAHAGTSKQLLRFGYRALLRDGLRGAARALAVELTWVLRRRTHLLARRLTNMRAGRGDVGPPRSSR